MYVLSLFFERSWNMSRFYDFYSHFLPFCSIFSNICLLLINYGNHDKNIRGKFYDILILCCTPKLILIHQPSLWTVLNDFLRDAHLKHRRFLSLSHFQPPLYMHRPKSRVSDRSALHSHGLRCPPVYWQKYFHMFYINRSVCSRLLLFVSLV